MSLNVKSKNLEQRDSIVLENDNQKIFGVLHRPLSDTPVPVVLMCHGLAGTKVSKQRLFVRLASLLVKAGIAVLRFDFRGNGDSEGELHQMTLEGEIKDALMMLDYLAATPFVDCARIGILGRSLGGAVAVLAAHRFVKVARIGLWSPVYSGSPWQRQWDQATDEMVDHYRVEGQRLGAVFLHELFRLDLKPSLNELAHIPLLHIHSEDDQIVPFTHAAEFRRCCLAKETEFIRLHKSGHEFIDVDEQQIVLQKTAQWFEKLKL